MMVYGNVDGSVYDEFGDYDGYEDELYEWEAEAYPYEFYAEDAPGAEWEGPQRLALPLDSVTIGAVAFILVLILGVFFDKDERHVAVAAPEVVAAAPQATPPPPPPAPPAYDPSIVSAPYHDYIITQGLHGFSYGHMAIDLKAGQGATVKSPIDGVVTAFYIDEIGNPTLVIENEIYQVTMLHGEYSVAVGDQLKRGQPVGLESNMGNTKDAWGNSCRGRDCGYHTHLNIFDKRLRSNINPFDVMIAAPGS